MWLFISTPAKPAPLTSFIFSATEPLTPTVPHIMAFLMGRFGAADVSGAFSSAPTACDAKVVSATALLLFIRNSRRCIELLFSPIHSFTHSPIHSFTHSPIHSFTHSLIHPLNPFHAPRLRSAVSPPASPSSEGRASSSNQSGPGRFFPENSSPVPK